MVGSVAHSVDWPQRSKPRLPSKALNGCGVRAAAAAAGGGAKVNPLIPSIGKAILHSRPAARARSGSLQVRMLFRTSSMLHENPLKRYLVLSAKGPRGRDPGGPQAFCPFGGAARSPLFSISFLLPRSLKDKMVVASSCLIGRAEPSCMLD